MTGSTVTSVICRRLVDQPWLEERVNGKVKIPIKNSYVAIPRGNLNGDIYHERPRTDTVVCSPPKSPPNIKWEIWHTPALSSS